MLSLISRKVISLIVFFFITLTLALVLILPSYTVAKNKESANFSKNIIMDILPLMYQYCFNSPIYYSGEYQKSNKIDIVIANHINTIDFGIYLSLVKKFDDRNPFFVMKLLTNFLLVMAFLITSSIPYGLFFGIKLNTFGSIT